MKQYLKSLLCVFFMILSFFLGYLFCLRQGEVAYTTKMNTPIYLDATTSKKSIILKQFPANVYLRINGELMQSGSIDLKE